MDYNKRYSFDIYKYATDGKNSDTVDMQGLMQDVSRRKSDIVQEEITDPVEQLKAIVADISKKSFGLSDTPPPAAPKGRPSAVDMWEAALAEYPYLDPMERDTLESVTPSLQMREGMGMAESLKTSYEKPDVMTEELPPAPVAEELTPTGGGLMAPPPKERPSQESTTESDSDVKTKIRNRLIALESFEGKAYKPVDTEEHYTIGYGHYGKDVKKDATISQEEALRLLDKDIDKRLVAIRKTLPDYDSMSDNLQVEIAQGWFRGDISGSPKTLALIKQGKYAEAADEFLDNDEYRNAVELGKPGIIPRMDAIADALRKEATK